jgi:nondiscriminating glutamyl-tRNA synthetase
MEVKRKPRVRFAPSPTGELHVGNARTALFNWLFARHCEGDFVLRIEDTDRERTSIVHEEGILNELKWLSLSWDEGPDKGGPYGPYRQSERLSNYKIYLDALSEKNMVYPCYCSEEELEADRSALRSRGMMPRYTGRCRGLSASDRVKLEKQGRKPTFRFRVDGGTLQFHDIIRGFMKFEREAIGDFIIVRSTGVPAYNFAVVVDDHLMEISHVIRGEDHLTNTALQLMLYETLGFDPPSFAHHALILGKDRAKLSKRHGSVSVRDFREKGILPHALVNYLSLLGASLGEGREVCSLEEIVRDFSLERAGRSGAVFDEDKLRWLNEIYMRHEDPGQLVDFMIPVLDNAGYNLASVDRQKLTAIVDTIRFNMTTLLDAREYLDIFFDDRYGMSQEAMAVLMSEDAGNVIRALRTILSGEKKDRELSYDHVIPILRKATGLSGKKLFLPIRAALTGKVSGPELDRIFVLLGRDSCLMRLEKAAAF